MLATRMPAIAGPTMRDALNIDELSAIAFIRSFAADHIDDEGLPRRNVERVHDAEQRGEREDVPDLHRAGEGQAASANASSIDAVCVAITTLWRLYRSATMPPIGEIRNTGICAAKAHRAQQHRGAGQPVDQPGLRRRSASTCRSARSVARQRRAGSSGIAARAASRAASSTSIVRRRPGLRMRLRARLVGRAIVRAAGFSAGWTRSKADDGAELAAHNGLAWSIRPEVAQPCTGRSSTRRALPARCRRTTTDCTTGSYVPTNRFR